jgi:MFS superfamily sulfate permease-like transporter
MKRKLLVLNHSLLFLCTSIYLGTGLSLVLFSFPVSPRLTPDNYYLQFVPQVTAATRFFTWMTLLLIALAVVMLVAEWRSRLRWCPAVVLAGVVAATGLTIAFILPYNEQMAAGITDPVQLREVLDRWMALNRVRVGMWAMQWLAMMTYFAVKLYQRETEHGQFEMAPAGAARHRGGHGAERAGAGASA